MVAQHSPEFVADLIAENRRLMAVIEDFAKSSGVLLSARVRPWGLTPQEWAFLCCLAKHGTAHNSQLLRAIKLHSQRIHFEEKIIDVLTCRVRKKIKPMGFVITSIWGEGKKLSEPGRAAVKQILGEV